MARSPPEGLVDLQTGPGHEDFDMASVMDVDNASERPRSPAPAPIVAPAEHDQLTQAAWFPARATVEDVEEESDSSSSSSTETGEQVSDEGTSSGSDDELEDEFEAHLEREWAELGACNSNQEFEPTSQVLPPANELTEEDLKVLRAFSFKVDENISQKTFERMRETFPELELDSFKLTKSRMQFLAAFKPVPYDCCINSCCCFVGPHAKCNTCSYCKEPRFNSRGLPRKRFMYLPFTVRLVAYYKNIPMILKMKYRHEFQHDPNCTKDVFDGLNYQTLCNSYVTIGGEQQRHKFFDSWRDIALGLSTDGFSPFRKRKQTCWPLLLFNYNLPPEIRFWLRYVICIGVIPGPKKPQDFDSFLWPAVEEFLKLLSGVRAYDASTEEMFLLRAYLILVFGDMPAAAMVMRMKGHNGFSPCRMCHIQGVRVPGSRGTTHYVPLDRSQHPDVRGSDNMVERYDAAALPLRTHAEFLHQAQEVQQAETAAEEDRLSRESGIKGVPLLASLPSLFFPKSCPHDFMHLMFENNLPNLVLLWTGKFKELDEGTGDYVLAPHVWEAIGEAMAASGATIPSAYGPRPLNMAVDKSQLTADAWSFWALYLGPILLRGCFSSSRYYKHFVLLVKLITRCLQFEITKEEINEVRVGFQQWVEEYERLYYQFKPERLPACPVTLHALLHVADGIEECGPVWAYWAFPMERFCGVLQPCIKSRRFPFANLDEHVTAVAQLAHIRTRHNLPDKLVISKASMVDERRKGFTTPSYPSCMLLSPRQANPVIDPALLGKIAACLSTRYGVSMAIARRNLANAKIECWGRLVCSTEGGDTVNASEMVKRSQEDSRDASYVRYELLVDRNARSRKKAPEYVPETFYGQLRRIFVLEMPASDELGTTESQTLILGSILTCKIEMQNDLDMHYFKQYRGTEVVDISTIQCLVGRVKDRGWWVIIDRSGKLARAQFCLD
ncbi:hypothetical protein CVT26_013426 [Gymnopilus dilepis]|uniref:Transposase family Tnp2 protein n=1 Tax=Gymnopilus dilepis TaxID=231916 RepID=A0A409WV66_9AGAR|nr:hypothetical protein CVT26_013426 [Gymnopilus dilepis]